MKTTAMRPQGESSTSVAKDTAHFLDEKKWGRRPAVPLKKQLQPAQAPVRKIGIGSTEAIGRISAGFKQVFANWSSYKSSNARARACIEIVNREFKTQGLSEVSFELNDRLGGHADMFRGRISLSRSLFWSPTITLQEQAELVDIVVHEACHIEDITYLMSLYLQKQKASDSAETRFENLIKHLANDTSLDEVVAAFGFEDMSQFYGSCGKRIETAPAVDLADSKWAHLVPLWNGGNIRDAFVDHDKDADKVIATLDQQAAAYRAQAIKTGTAPAELNAIKNTVAEDLRAHWDVPEEKAASDVGSMAHAQLLGKQPSSQLLERMPGLIDGSLRRYCIPEAFQPVVSFEKSISTDVPLLADILRVIQKEFVQVQACGTRDPLKDYSLTDLLAKPKGLVAAIDKLLSAYEENAEADVIYARLASVKSNVPTFLVELDKMSQEYQAGGSADVPPAIRKSFGERGQKLAALVREALVPRLEQLRAPESTSTPDLKKTVAEASVPEIPEGKVDFGQVANTLVDLGTVAQFLVTNGHARPTLSKVLAEFTEFRQRFILQFEKSSVVQKNRFVVELKAIERKLTPEFLFVATGYLIRGLNGNPNQLRLILPRLIPLIETQLK